MRAFLLASVFTTLAITSARAQLPVIDVEAQAQLVIANINGATQIAKWATQLQDMARQYEELVAQYRELVNTYDAIEHTTSVSDIANTLGGVSRFFMPSASSMQGLMNGSGGLWNNAPQLMSQAQYYQSTNNDPWQQEMTRRQQVTANAGAMALAAEQDAQQGILNLTAMKARIEVGQNGTENIAVGSYIALEQQRLDNNRAQMQGIQAMLAVDERVIKQRAEQLARQSAEALMAQTAPVTVPWQ